MSFILRHDGNCNGDLNINGTLNLQETGGGLDKITLQAPASISAYTLTLPIDNGANNQILKTDGSGVLSWTNSVAGSDTQLQFNNAGVSGSSSNLTFSGSTLTVNGTITDGTALMVGGALSGVTTLTSSGNLTKSAGDILLTGSSGQTITKSGVGHLTIQNNIGSGNVTVEGVEFLNNAISGATTIGASGAITTASVILNDADESNTITVQTPAVVAADYTLTLPINTGTLNQVLKTDGTGTLAWTDKRDLPGSSGKPGKGLIDLGSDKVGWKPVLTSQHILQSPATSYTEPETTAFQFIVYAPELPLFVTASTDGTDRVSTSPDGIMWTARNVVASDTSEWRCVAWSPELTMFVLVSVGTNQASSPDGINWTIRTSPNNNWSSVIWASGLSLFVALSYNTGTNNVMTSPDGINWTSVAMNISSNWQHMTWSEELSLIVGVSYNGTLSTQVVTSPDALIWTSRSSSAVSNWRGVAWSPELYLFAAVSTGGTDTIMTSPDGITWTTRTSPTVEAWKKIIWSSELALFLAVGYSKMMVSSDGITWTYETVPNKNYNSLAWSPELLKLVLVSPDATERIIVFDAVNKATHLGEFESNALVLKETDGNENKITIQAPTLVADYTLTLPINTGTTDQILKTDGSGILSWITTGSSTFQETYDASSPPEIIVNNTEDGLVIKNATTPITGDLFTIGNNDLTTKYFNITATTMTVPNVISIPTTGHISFGSTAKTNDNFDFFTGSGNAPIQFYAPGAATAFHVVFGTTIRMAAGNGGDIRIGYSTAASTTTGSIKIGEEQTSGSIILGNSSQTGNVVVNSDIILKKNLYIEDPGVGSSTIAVQSPTLVSNYTLTLPTDAGTVDQVLKTDGSGVLSWTTPVGGGGGSPGGVDTNIQFNESDAFGGDTELTWNTTTKVLGLVGTLALKENSKTISITSPSTLYEDYTITFPNNQGFVNSILSNDSNGNLSWKKSYKTFLTPIPLEEFNLSVYKNVTKIVWAPELSLFVAINVSGSGDRVITSPDGLIWTFRTTPADLSWYNLVWAPEIPLFVAVANSGTGNRVMTSPDGITWTSRTSAVDNNWYGLAWSPSIPLFVATSNNGSANRVMTSPDGITWTARTTPDQSWQSVVWAESLGLFVSVSRGGAGSCIMTSPDGITWTLRTTPANSTWVTISWSPELNILVAGADNGGIMYSTDGITWILCIVPASARTTHIIWIPELNIFVSNQTLATYQSNKLMTSPDGINWSLEETITSTDATFSQFTYSSVLNKLVCFQADLCYIYPLNSIYDGSLQAELVTIKSESNNKFTTIKCDSAENYSLTLPPSKGIDKNTLITDGTGKLKWTHNPVSTDLLLINNTQHTETNVSGAYRSVAWSPVLKMYVALSISSTDRLMYSYDGQLWENTGLTQPAYAIDNVSWSKIIWVGDGWNSFVACGFGGGVSGEDRIIYSIDGLEWFNPVDTDIQLATFRDMVWSEENRRVVLIADNNTETSLDRILSCDTSNATNRIAGWSRENMSNNGWYGITYSPELKMYYAISTGTKFSYTTNATALSGWTDINEPDALSWQSVAWSSKMGLFVACAASGTERVWYSKSGLLDSWTGIDVGAFGFRKIIWVSELGLFVLVGDTEIITSPDAINWTSETVSGQSFFDIAYSSERNQVIISSASGTDKITSIYGTTKMDGQLNVGYVAPSKKTYTQLTSNTTDVPVNTRTGRIECIASDLNANTGFDFNITAEFITPESIVFLTTITDFQATVVNARAITTGNVLLSVTNANTSNFGGSKTITVNYMIV